MITPTTIAELERRRLLAGERLAAAAQRAADDPNDSTASAEVEINADSLAHYGSVLREARSLPTAEVVGPYREGSPYSFLADMVSAEKLNDRGAQARLQRHQDIATMEMRSTTGAFGGLVVPQYPTDSTGVGLHNLDPFVQTVGRPLPPEGMTFNLAKVGSAGSASAETQNGEGAAITGTAPSTTLTTATVCEEVLSFELDYQLLDRGRDAVDWALAESVAAFRSYVEQEAIGGPGTSNRLTGALTTSGIATQAFTGTTAASFLTALTTAIRTSVAARGLSPDLIVLHGRRWAWLLNGASQPAVSTTPPPGAPPLAVGQALGIPVITSNGISTALGVSTNEDAALVIRSKDVFLGVSPIMANLERQRTGTATTTLKATYRLKQDAVLDCTRWAGATVKLTGTGMV